MALHGVTHSEEITTYPSIGSIRIAMARRFIHLSLNPPLPFRRASRVCHDLLRAFRVRSATPAARAQRHARGVSREPGYRREPAARVRGRLADRGGGGPRAVFRSLGGALPAWGG